MAANVPHLSAGMMGLTVSNIFSWKVCVSMQLLVDYEQWLMLRPVSPVLSNESIRRTPRPGLLTGTKSVPHNWEGVLRGHNLKAVQCEDVPEEPPPKLQDVLYVRPYKLEYEGLAVRIFVGN